MSSTLGIGIWVKYPGNVYKVQYSTEYGAFLKWNSNNGTIAVCGQDVELPYDLKLYWTPLGDNNISPGTKSISIKARVLDENEKLLTEDEIKILHGDLYTVQASPNVIIGVKDKNRL